MPPDAVQSTAPAAGIRQKERINVIWIKNKLNQWKRTAFWQNSVARNLTVCFGIFAAATAAAASVAQFSASDTVNVAMIYILSVLMIARYTDGYVPGILASVVSTFCVNLLFTYPYMELNFTLEGYPATFLCMLATALITSAATSRMKEQSRILNEREKLLMEAEKEKMRANLLRAVSHDLRTPLTSIIGTSSAYLENNKTLSCEEKAHMIQNIQEDANWLLNMVENLLSVTRIREGGAHSQVSKSPEPLEEVVSEAVLRFRKRLPAAKVNVQIPDDFVMIPMDATLIEQVLINLLENAYYHGDPEKPIRLSAFLQNSSAFFQVSDEGPGIPQELLPAIFDGSAASFQSSDSRKGMGIGLSICKTIISAHGGMIQAGNLSNGACFTFSLPLGENTNDTQTNYSDH